MHAVNFAGKEECELSHTGDVEKILPRFSAADVVILDPPRDGAKQECNCEPGGTALNPRAIVYVACDPAALARDSALS